MKIKELMTKKVITAKKSDPISKIAKLMANFDIGMVVIINDSRDVLGVVTDRDIVIRALSMDKFNDPPVETVMTNHCVNINRNESAVRALEMMGEYQVRRLVVTNEENKLAGVPLVRGKGHLSPIEMLRSALRGMEVERDPAKRDMEVWWRIARLACRDAVKLGQYIGRQEAEELLRRLELCRTPYSCPHGRPTIYILDNKKLEDWFER